MSASLQEQGYATRYGPSTGYGAYTGLVRSPDGAPLTNPDRIRPGQEYLVPVARTTAPAPGRPEASPRATERVADATVPRGVDDRYGGRPPRLGAQPETPAAQYVLPLAGPAVAALARAAPAQTAEALVLEELSAEALLLGPKPPPAVWPYLLPVATWGWAAYEWYHVYRLWRSVEQGREEARALLEQSQEGVRRLWQNGLITDEEYNHYRSTGKLVVQPEAGPRPYETGAQYERRVFRGTPLAEASKTYQGWRGGANGSLSTWWNAVRGRFGAAAQARAERVLAMSASQFVTAFGSRQLRSSWAKRQSIRDKLLKDLEQARKELKETPSEARGKASARVDELTKELDEINSAESMQIGNMRPDQIELFFDLSRAVVTDITLALGEPWHILKSLIYRDVVRVITGYVVDAIEFRTSQQQVILGSAPPQQISQTPAAPKEPDASDAGVAPSR